MCLDLAFENVAFFCVMSNLMISNLLFLYIATFYLIFGNLLDMLLCNLYLSLALAKMFLGYCENDLFGSYLILFLLFIYHFQLFSQFMEKACFPTMQEMLYLMFRVLLLPKEPLHHGIFLAEMFFFLIFK